MVSQWGLLDGSRATARVDGREPSGGSFSRAKERRLGAETVRGGADARALASWWEGQGLNQKCVKFGASCIPGTHWACQSLWGSPLLAEGGGLQWAGWLRVEGPEPPGSSSGYAEPGGLQVFLELRKRSVAIPNGCRGQRMWHLGCHLCPFYNRQRCQAHQKEAVEEASGQRREEQSPPRKGDDITPE